MKKTTKTSKQKRVLVVSILLAALIVAGGTFAWFTSKDEVTNKLSASNDYGVTITETFTPPDQWLPGEDVEKKVSVINTGNIDAFVKLSLKNAIDLKVMDEDDKTYTANNASNYIKLDAAEVTSLQAGGYLVYEAGIAITDESDMLVGTDYTPSASGLYLFRRNVTQGNPDTYEYAGYYYDGTDYYAVNPSVTPEEDETVTYGATYPKTKAVSNADLVLNYDAVSTDNYVKATYAGEDANSTEDDIVIYINLDSTELDNWKLIDSEFYYKKILAAGKSTGNLVTSVTLGTEVENDAYVSFDYYLTVTTDSAQVTTDDDKTTAVNAQGWAAEAALDTDDTDKVTVNWTKKQNP